MATTVPRPSSATDSISYADLYARWERGNWRATEIDLSADAVDWHERLSPEQRRGALWLYALFFHGEDTVADDLSPYVDAAPTEEQTYFLTTQQVDEARHSVFFHRFMHEVVGLGDAGSVGSTLAASEAQLTWGHRKVFTRLNQMADELRRDRSKVQLARAVTLYHIVVEASMAQAGQHMIEDSLTQYDVLPGFREGMGHVSQDEQRHIGFGVKLLSDLYAEDPERIGDAILGTIREVLPWTAAVAAPPGWDPTYTESFGFTFEDLGEAGARSMEQKLRTIGLPLDTMPNLPCDPAGSPRERATNGMRLLKANYIGPGGPVDRAEIERYFRQMAHQADTRKTPDGMVVQWDFTDADPWHLTLTRAGASAEQGRAGSPDLTIRASLQDWVDVTAERADPRKLVLTRRLRPSGKLWLLPRMRAAMA